MLDNNLIINSKLSETIDEVQDQKSTESKGILVQNVETDGSGSDSKTNYKNLDLTENKEVLQGCDESTNRLTNESQNSIISIRKLEDLCATPKKNDTLVALENIKVENTCSPQVFSPSNLSTSLIEYHSNTVKVSQESPIPFKREIHHLDTDDTERKPKRRKLSTDIDDYDQLSDILKSELCNNDLNDMEAIDMLHDLNSVMDFEETKVSTHFFCSTANNSVQTEQGAEMSRDPEMDPLFIPDRHEAKKKAKNTKGQAKREKRNGKDNLNKEHECYKNKKNEGYNKSTRKRKSVDENNDNNDDVIKDILGELDIDLDPEDSVGGDGIPADEIERLYNLEIKITHKVPPQHMIEHTAGSKTLTRLERKQFLKHGPLKSGAFTPTEDRVITDNWLAFCEEHDWNPEYVTPFLNMKTANKFYIRTLEERQKFTQVLANGLPWRTLYSVYHRFKYLYGNHERSFKRYTRREDKTILSHVQNKQNKEKSPKKFTELGKMLGRTSHSVWLRYQLLKKTRQKKPTKASSEVQWTLPMIGKFITVFMDVTLCEDVEELKDAIVPKVVWQKLEQKLKIDYNVLKTFWIHQLHMQLFCPEPIYLNDIKIKLIEYVYGKGIASTREIVWSSVAKYFDGVTSIFLCRIFLYLVQEAAIKIGTNNFPDIAEYLYNEKIQDIRNEASDKFLPRLSYNNGDVIIIDKDGN